MRIFLVICLFVLVNTFILNEYILSSDLLFNSYKGVVSEQMINKLIRFQEKYAWGNYVLVPIILLFKTALVTLCISIGSFLSNERFNFNFIWKKVVVAEIVFVAYSLIRTLLLLKKDFSTLSEVQEYMPFTLFSLFKNQELPVWSHYVLSLISISELIYLIVLAWLLMSVFERKWFQSLCFVVRTYGVGMVLWASLIVFLTINFSV